MAWYDDKKKTTHVALYKDAEAAEREGRVAVGRAITKGLFTAGTGLLKGRPRKGGKITVTYEHAQASPMERDA